MQNPPPPHDIRQEKEEEFLYASAPWPLILLTAGLSIAYFTVVTTIVGRGNPILFGLLVASHAFFLVQLLIYLHTVWNTDYVPPHTALPGPASEPERVPSVDVFITVAGEPIDIIEQTTQAARDMDYPSFRVFLLNDGYVLKKENWREAEQLAKQLGIQCITRTTPGGAKAGNINHAFHKTEGDLIAIFDADHVPHADFLSVTVPYFQDPDMGFVQSPQYYKNHNVNYLAGGAWEQQTLFFGPICRGKNRMNAVTMCGTNMLISRKALQEVGGMCTESITEDFLTGMFMHEKGWRSAYVPKILAEGLAPEDFLSYYKQQFRWARGGLDMLFSYNLFSRKLSFIQKIQYASSIGFFFTGVFVLINALIPVFFLYTGVGPVTSSAMALAALFVPFIFTTIYILQRSSGFSLTYRGLAFSMASFAIQLNALLATIIGKKAAFAVTSKRAVQGKFLNLVIPHMVYIPLVLGGIGFALFREGFSPAVAINISWAIVHVAVFVEFIRAALVRETPQEVAAPVPSLERSRQLFPGHIVRRKQESAAYSNN